MKIRLFGTANDSIVDGPGIRYAVFVQGCCHGCEGCHNPKSHDVSGGYDGDTEEILGQILKNPLLDGVTLSGGEPFMQAKPLCRIAKEVRARGMNVVTYTGFDFEYLLEHANDDNGYMELLRETDILVDGKFVLAQRSIDLVFKGSKNQRIIDVQKSLKEGRTVIHEIDKENNMA